MTLLSEKREIQSLSKLQIGENSAKISIPTDPSSHTELLFPQKLPQMFHPNAIQKSIRLPSRQRLNSLTYLDTTFPTERSHIRLLLSHYDLSNYERSLLPLSYLPITNRLLVGHLGDLYSKIVFNNNHLTISD